MIVWGSAEPRRPHRPLRVGCRFSPVRGGAMSVVAFMWMVMLLVAGLWYFTAWIWHLPHHKL